MLFQCLLQLPPGYPRLYLYLPVSAVYLDHLVHPSYIYYYTSLLRYRLTVKVYSRTYRYHRYHLLVGKLYYLLHLSPVPGLYHQLGPAGLV